MKDFIMDAIINAPITEEDLRRIVKAAEALACEGRGATWMIATWEAARTAAREQEEKDNEAEEKAGAVIRFKYYRRLDDWKAYNRDPKGDGEIMLNLDGVLSSKEWQGESKPYPLDNLRKVFRVLHTQAPEDVREAQERIISRWLDRQYHKNPRLNPKDAARRARRLSSMKKAFVDVCKKADAWEAGV